MSVALLIFVVAAASATVLAAQPGALTSSWSNVAIAESRMTLSLSSSTDKRRSAFAARQYKEGVARNERHQGSDSSSNQ